MAMYVAITEKIRDGTLTLIEVRDGGVVVVTVPSPSPTCGHHHHYHVTCEVLCHLLIMYPLVAHTLHGPNVITKIFPSQDEIYTHENA